MEKLRLLGILCIFIFLLSSVLVLADEEPVIIGLNSTKIIEPSKEPNAKIGPLNIKEFDKSLKLNENSQIKNQATNDLITKLGESYFNNHFSYIEAKNIGNSVCLKYEYTYNTEKVDMLICYNTENEELLPHMNSILDFPQDVSFTKEEAFLKIDELGLPSEREIKLVYDSSHKTLGWKIIWDHEPTQQERIQEVIKGYTLSVEDGSLLKTHKFDLDPIGEPIFNKEDEIDSKVSIFKVIKNFFINLFRIN